GPGATAGGQEGTTVRPSPVSARRASALVDAAMNAGRIDAAAMQAASQGRVNTYVLRYLLSVCTWVG
ncbi:hypothetical protein SARC_16381, partial [Sphaeroforma arctica JP610]